MAPFQHGARSEELSYELLVLERRDNVGVISLNRPEVLNALSRQLSQEIDTAVSELEADEDVRAVVFTGTGERAFSAGADIHEMARNAEAADPPPPEPRRPNYS